MDDSELSDILGESPPKQDAPPKPKMENPSGDRKRTAPWARKLETQLTDLYTSIGTGFAISGDAFASAIIGTHAESLASAWVDLAEQDQNVKNTLLKLMSGSAWGGVIILHSMVILPIVANRGWIPGELGTKLQMATAMMAPTPDYGPNGNGNGNSD